MQQGFGTAIVQFNKLEREHLDTAFWINVVFATVLTLLGIFAAEVVADLFKQPGLTPVVRWLSIGFIIGALNGVQQAIFRRKMEFKTLALCSTIANISGGIVGVVLAFLGFGVWSLIFKTLSSGIVGVVVIWILSDWRPGFRFSRKHFKELYSFSLSVMGTNFLSFFTKNMDNLLIGYFLGPAALGFYDISYRLLRILNTTLGGTINRVALPAFSKIQKETDRLRNVLYNAIQITSFVAFPAFLGIGAIAPELVLGLFGKQWAQSIPVMQILVFISLLQCIFVYNGTIMLAMGKPSWQLGLKFINTLANVIAFAFVVRWGIEAVALAFVIRGYLLSPLPLLLIRKLLDIKLYDYIRKLLPALTGSIVMVVCLWKVKDIISSLMGLHISLIVYIAVGIVVYTVTILLISPNLIQQSFELTRLAFNIRPGREP